MQDENMLCSLDKRRIFALNVLKRVTGAYDSMHLKRDINKLGLLFVSVGAMVGSGWLFGPLYAAQISGPASVLTWGLAGVLVLVVSLTFAELSTMFPLSGGIARFPQFSHGALAGYALSWLAWVASIMLPAVEVEALIQYAASYDTGLMHASANGTPVLSLLGFGVAAILLGFMSFLNIMGIKRVTRFNVPLVWLKLAVPLLTAIVLIGVHFDINNFTHFGGMMPYGLKSVLSALPMAGVIFSFFGFRLCVELAGETKNPQKTLPLALIGSILICMVLYSLVQFAFIGVLPADALNMGFAHVHYPGDYGPFAGIATHFHLYQFLFILYIDAILSPFGSALIVVTAASRLNYAMSIEGCLPRFLQRLNRNGVPYWAVWVNFMGGLLLLLPFPNWQKLAEFILAALILAHMLVPIVLLSLRLQRPKQPRPFRVPCASLTCWLAFVILNLILYWTGWSTIDKMLVVLVVGLLVLGLFRHFQATGERVHLHAKQVRWLWPYFVVVATTAWAGNFGHGHAWLPFGWDMAWVALYATVFFFWGVRCRLSDQEAATQLTREQHIIRETGEGIV